MASSLVIVVKTARTSTDMADRLSVDASSPRPLAMALSNFFASAAGGFEACSVDVATGPVAPVAGTDTITISYSDAANADTVTIAGTALTCVTGTPSGPQFKKVTDGTVTAANLAALINSNATTSKYVYATSALSVVTLTSFVKHATANLITVATSNATGFVIATAALAGGAGGQTALPTNYVFGI